MRRDFIGGLVLTTLGVRSLSHDTRAKVLAAVREFDDFCPENDPYGERDFGNVTISGTKYFFKIDYYDQEYLGHSSDKANPEITRRVLTIMEASEY